MATSDLMNQIASNYAKLTKAEKRVADVVLATPGKVLHSTITDLAELCKVGETSVFRFCRTLNLNGYQDFKVSLALSTSSASTRAEGEENLSEDDLIQSVYHAYQRALEDTVNSIHYASIRRAVDFLINAKHIHFFGMGGSGITALEAQNKFLKITPNVSFHIDTHAQITTATLIDPESVAVIFSNSGVTKDCIELARLAKSNNARVIFITKFARTPAKKYSDIILLSGAVEGPMQGGSIEGKVSQAFAVDLLYEEFYRRSEKHKENKSKTAASIAEKML